MHSASVVLNFLQQTIFHHLYVVLKAHCFQGCNVKNKSDKENCMPFFFYVVSLTYVRGTMCKSVLVPHVMAVLIVIMGCW